MKNRNRNINNIDKFVGTKYACAYYAKKLALHAQNWAKRGTPLYPSTTTFGFVRSGDLPEQEIACRMAEDTLFAEKFASRVRFLMREAGLNLLKFEGVEDGTLWVRFSR